MTITLSPLPFEKQSLAPHISEETISFHYNKHHQTYVNNLNKLIIGTEFENKDLIDIIKTSSGSIFNNAAQTWNHSFYWNCLTPSKNELASDLLQAINTNFGNLDNFKESFTKTALGLFGSGWVWLVKESNNNLSIIGTNNAQTPLTSKQIPLLTCDVWEHAYYIDYRNARAKYLESFWQIINWDFVNQNFVR